MSGKAVLILVLGAAMAISIAFINISENSAQATDNMVRYYNQQNAFNIAQTGIHMSLRQLADSSSWRTGFSNINIFSGNLTTTLADTTLDSIDVVMITSTATVGAGTNLAASQTSRAYAQVGGSGYMPAAVLAAITTNNQVETNGTLIVDGRDHDINGNLIGGTGTHAIWTTNSYNRKGNSKLGSSVSGTDYAPAKSENDNYRLEGQTYPGGSYPDNPDEVLGGAAMGYPAGTLKSIAISGKGGSQYVTNPALLSNPLKGVTYVELASGGTWNPANIQGEGILIVHNSTKDAVIKNINWSTFKGLIIADDIVHIHADIIGALIGLSPSPSSGNQIGNGNGHIKYSTEAIKKATTIGSGGLTSGNSSSNVVAWWD